MKLVLKCEQKSEINTQINCIAVTVARLPLAQVRLPFLAACRLALARSFAVLVIDVVDGADDAERNYEESDDAEEKIRSRGLFDDRHQLRLKCQRCISYSPHEIIMLTSR